MSATKRVTLVPAFRPHPGPQESDPGLEYLAGFFDGEGSIRYNNTPETRVSNTDLSILVAYWNRWGGSIIRTAAHTKNPRWRTQYAWSACGDRAVKVCMDLLEHLHEKRNQAELLLLMREMPRWKRDDIRHKLSEMKHVDDLEREDEILP